MRFLRRHRIDAYALNVEIQGVRGGFARLERIQRLGRGLILHFNIDIIDHNTKSIKRSVQNVSQIGWKCEWGAYAGCNLFFAIVARSYGLVKVARLGFQLLCKLSYLFSGFLTNKGLRKLVDSRYVLFRG